MFYVMKKQLDNFPFADLHATAMQAMSRVRQEIVGKSRELHDKRVAELIAATYASREDSYEGNENEDYPFIGPDPSYVQEQMNAAKKDAVAAFAKKHDMPSAASWIMPQLFAHIAKMPLQFDESGKVNISTYLQQFGVDDFHKGLYQMCIHPVRGDFISKQYTPEFASYGALVPLLLAPHKKFNNVPYNAWPRENISKVTDPNLSEAMLCTFEHAISTADMLEMRLEALKVKTGKNAGGQRNPMTSHMVYGLTGELKSLPWLVKVMMFQVWCAHPSNRTNMSILNWLDWDNMPEPLITTEISTTKSKLTVTKADDWMPDWMNT